MARIFLEPNDTSYIISDPGAKLYGHKDAPVAPTITILPTAVGAEVDQQVGRVNLGGNIEDFAFKSTGNVLQVFDAAGNLLVSIPVQDDEDGTALGTNDGVFDVKVNNDPNSENAGTVTVGDKPVPKAESPDDDTPPAKVEEPVKNEELPVQPVNPTPTPDPDPDPTPDPDPDPTPPTTGGGTTTTPPAPSFSVTESGTAPNVKVEFANASGTINVTFNSADNTLSFTNGSATKKTTAKTDQISEIVVGSGLTLKGDAAALHTNKVTGDGKVEMTAGADGAQTIEVLTTGANKIEGGKGADQITLGSGTGKDQIVVKSGDANTAPTTAGSDDAGNAGTAASTVYTGAVSKLTAGDTIVFTYKGEALTATIGTISGSTATAAEVQTTIDAALTDTSGGSAAGAAGDVVASFENSDADLKLTAKDVGDTLVGGDFTDVDGAAATTAGSDDAGNAGTAASTVYTGAVSKLTAGDTIVFTYKGEALTATIGTISGSTATAAEVQTTIDAALTDTSGGSAAGAAGDVVASFENSDADLKLTAKDVGDTLVGGDFTDVDGVSFTASDSNVSAMDTITNFDLTNDKLQLSGGTDLFASDSGAPFTVVAGVVGSVTYTGTAAEKLQYVMQEVFLGMDNTKSTAAYHDGTDTYIFQGDGVADYSDADIVIKLAGIDATGDLGNILI